MMHPPPRATARPARGEDAGSCPSALARHLAAARSVTEGLFTWCEARGIGEGPIRVLARGGGAAPAELEALLAGHSPPGLPPRAFRRVVLGRAGLALVEADNLFLPGRLPAGMRATLEATDTPFGTVVAPLGPARRTIAVVFGPEAGRAAVLTQSALVLAADGLPIAAVRERFLPPLLG